MTIEKPKRSYPDQSQEVLSEEQRLDLLAEYMLDRIIAKITRERNVAILINSQERGMLKV